MDILRREIPKPVSHNKPEVDQAKTSQQRRSGRINKLFFWTFLLVCLTALVVAGYFYRQNIALKQLLPSVSVSPNQQEIGDIINRVGRLIVLPEGEEPTVATVSDPAKLKDQAFFANAQAGDKVLIYSKAQKAILYDPAADKIVEVAPLNINPSAIQSVAPASIHTP